MSRRAFIESHGATCRNWSWSWSFVNHAKRIVIFGACYRFEESGRSKIFSKDWERNANSRKKPGYEQSLDHIRLIENEKYALQTFPMLWSSASGDEGVARIDRFIPELGEKVLVREGNSWFAAKHQ